MGKSVISARRKNDLRGVRRNSAGNRRLLLGIYVALAAGTLAVFSGVGRHDFINYDDDDMIYDNPHVEPGLTLDGLKFALTGPHVGNWQPLTTLSHMLDCQWFGVERPGLHHLESLGLHLASVLLLFEALRRMTGEPWPSALVAALFAIHPLHVESVAWASERKDVLSGLFWMLTLLAYVWYARRPALGRYLVVCLSLGLGLMSKPMLVSLPCVLLLLDWWPLGRWRSGTDVPEPHVEKHAPPRFPQQPRSRLILEKLPLLAASVAVGCATALAQRAAGVGHPSLAALSMSWRLTNAVWAYFFYLWKTIWPTNLAFFYPHPGLAPGADIRLWVVPALGAALLLLAITWLAAAQAFRRPYLAVGWLWYLGTLVPVIGLFQVGMQAYADRYTYLPLIGVYLAMAWGARDLVRRWPYLKTPLLVCGSIWLASLMLIAWCQVGYWQNSQTLYEHTLEVTTDNFVIHNNLGSYLRHAGQIPEAIHQYELALQIKSADPQVHNNLGNALLRAGRTSEAIRYFQRALELRKNYPDAHYNLGNALAILGRQEQAKEQYEQALREKSNFAEAHYTLGILLMQMGKPVEAAVHLEQARQLEGKESNR